MKPKLFLIYLLISSFGFAAFAQKTTAQPALKTIQFKEIFTSLSIEDDMDVVLTEGNSDKILVVGDVRAIVADNHLYIAARNPRLASGMRIMVPAGYLTKVYMNGNGSLSSASILRNHKIKIYLSSEARINVRGMGNITVETIDDIQFVRTR